MTAFERKLKNCSEHTIPTKFVFGAMKSTQELEKQEKKNYAKIFQVGLEYKLSIL